MFYICVAFLQNELANAQSTVPYLKNEEPELN